MGGRIRKYVRQLLRVAAAAALPCVIIFAIVVTSFIQRRPERDLSLTPEGYLRLLGLCYAAAFIATSVLEYRSLIHAATKADAHLIGKAFGGFRKQDKLFCDAMDLYAKDRIREALELYLQVQEFELNDAETGVLSFYIGRCYQLLSCPSNAISFYDKALQNGFSKPFAQLFKARSYADGGSFDESYRLFCEILEHDPPEEFYFLYTDIGFLYIRQKQPEKAEEWFQRSIASMQNYAFALSGMAIVSLQKGDFKAAQDYHYKALVNRLDNPARFRRYYEDTKRLMLEEHPEWDTKAGAEPDDAQGSGQPEP